MFLFLGKLTKVIEECLDSSIILGHLILLIGKSSEIALDLFCFL